MKKVIPDTGRKIKSLPSFSCEKRELSGWEKGDKINIVLVRLRSEKG
jgi:hypothetical protein